MIWPNLDEMKEPSRFSLARLWSDHGHRLLRYGGVTLVTTAIGFTTLFLGLVVFDWHRLLANFVSVLVSTPFAYYLNRHYVWEQAAGNHSLSNEVTPFWIMTGFGFVISTAAVWAVGVVTDSEFLQLLAQPAAFGALWLIKFAFLEKYLWPDAEPSSHRVSDAA